jgi:hypothetical protein
LGGADSAGSVAKQAKAVIDQMEAIELNESGQFHIPSFAKTSVVNKPASEAHSGANPFTSAYAARGQASQQFGQGITPEGC